MRQFQISKGWRRVIIAALALGFMVLDVILLLTALHFVGTDGRIYYDLQLKAKILPEAGICNAELRALDGMLADYLSGDAEALNGAPFNAKELTHMADCFKLFELLRAVRARLIPWAILLVLGSVWLLRDRRAIRRCAWLGPLLVLLPLALFALYAAFNFNAAFTLFHRVLFTNDLWLLDPRTDLLIRICPESMFMKMGIRIAVISLTSIVAVSAIATVLTYLWPGRRGRDTWKTTTRRAPAPKQISFGQRDTR